MAEKIKFACACGKQLTADAAAAGKRAKCPACGQVVQVPQSSAKPETAAKPPAAPAKKPGAVAAAAPKQGGDVQRKSSPPPPPAAAKPATPSIWDQVEEDDYKLANEPTMTSSGNGNATIDPRVDAMRESFERQTGTAASNAGRFKPNWLHVCKNYYPGMVILPAIMLVLTIVAVVWPNRKPGLPLILLAATVWTEVSTFMQMRRYCAAGDVNPAMVLNRKKGLIAILVDMSQGGAPQWFIRVQKQRLGTMAGGPYEDGSRLTVVSLYTGSAPNGCWRNAPSLTCGSLTDDVNVLNRLNSSVPEAHWQMLAREAQNLEQQKPGSYAVRGVWG